ncbi:DNA recombination protein RmuC [Pontiella agarivorans]|uniref:DNA recombination protein RmuC n=1 Tax=Pontiella agarivorans TaxID=3038953 RepID=A0ABU5N1L0_9BACT|nr:DNA recombination protein RmuC [Pontiella agarivorans]MDZ8120343.1 DNA recombination protein RmuC [Pontiella agarivorans]
MITTVLLILVLVVLGTVLMLQLTGMTKVNTRLDEFARQIGVQNDQGAERIEKLEYIFRGLEKELREDVESVRVRVDESLEKNSRQFGERVRQLIETNEKRLGEISGKVEERLDKGFEKTSKVFEDVLKRLVEIDKAQEKIAELSGNVVSLQEVLSDKRSRGAFGEVQLNALIANIMPENSFSLQHTFSNGVRADCVLFLPEPTGTICIDSKFPLESYQKMVDFNLGDADRKAAEQQFRQDIRKHIKDISSKYIIPGETSDGAMMFIPAEAIFAEIHARYPDLVEEAQRARVWLTSPTTMMAVLTTSRAVLKDAATRKQVHIIQEHLVALSKDFERFQNRMDKLATHIDQANKDVGLVQTSAKKISSRFTKIEKVELEGEDFQTLENPEI